MESFGKFVVGFVLFVFALTIRGMVFQDLWGWFVTPFGVAAITFLHALGLSLFISYAASDHRTDEGTTLSAKMGVSIIVSLLCWCVGALYTVFM